MKKFSNRQILILVSIMLLLSASSFFVYWRIIKAGTPVLNDQGFLFDKKEDDQVAQDIFETDAAESGPGNIADIPLINYRPIKLLFFGDLMLDRHVGEIINRHGLDHLLNLLNINEFTLGYDLVLANLEGAVTNQGNHYPPINLYDFAFSPDLISQLKDYNFNFFLLANNHLADQGQLGISETYQNLSDLGFYYVGCQDAKLSPSNDFPVIDWRDQKPPPVLTAADCSVRVLEINGRRLAILAFSAVYQQIPEDKIIEKIRLIKEQADWLIVSPHWGLEYQSLASAGQVNLARQMILAGADAIIGHHPHVIQNQEVYQDKPIFYSLGNFIFDQYFSLKTQEGLAVALNLFHSGEITWEVYKIKTSGSRITEIRKLSAQD